MKNPNGYGTVFKLGGNRRRPFIARKTLGYDDLGHPSYAVIGYYPTRKDAMIALAEYNANPYDLKLARSTFSQVYEVLKEERFPQMGKSLKAQHEASYKYCGVLYDIPYTDLRQLHFQRVIDACQKKSMQACIKNLFVQMDKLAYDLEIIDKMRSANLTVSAKETKIKREPFTQEEISKLWEHVGEPFVDETLTMLYTGMRVSEMLLIRCKDVDIEQGTITGGMKTAAGKNRVIPIHDKLRPVIESHMSKSEYLFTYTNDHDPEKIADAFRRPWEKALSVYGIHHYTHDCRHTFRSALDGQNQVCVNLIMGHKTSDIGERIYTHKTIEQLKETVQKLTY